MATADVNIDLAALTLSALTLEDKAINRLAALIHSYKTRINNRFIELQEILVYKQICLMEELDNILADVRTQRQTHDDQLRQLHENKELVQTKLTHNKLNIVLRNTLKELQDNINKLDNARIDIPMVDIKFDNNLFNTVINNICSIEIGKLDYINRTKPIWSTVSQGREQKQLKYPQGLAVDNISGDIYVADSHISADKDHRIQIYNSIGEYVRTISGCRDYVQLHRILIDTEFCYLTCSDFLGNLLIKINKLSDCIDTINNRVDLSHHGFNNYKEISGMDLDNINIFICMGSHEILVVNKTNLIITNTIQLQMEHKINSQTIARDIKLLSTELIILFINTDYPLQCFSREGVLLRTIISKEQLPSYNIVTHYLILNMCYFCIDMHNNFIISDYKDNNIKIFSPSGKLITSIGKIGQGIGEFNKPQGICLDLNNRIIICDMKDNYMLQAF